MSLSNEEISVLDMLKDLLTSDEAPTSEELAERRREVRAEIEEVEGQLRRLEHDPAEGLKEADEVGDRARRRRALEDRLEDLEALNAALAERQKEAEHRERVHRAGELKEEIPKLAEELKEAKAAYRRVGRRLSEFVAEAGRIRAKLGREGVDFHLARDAVHRLREIHDDLPNHHASTLDNLEPPEEKDGQEKKIIQHVGEAETEFVGPWSDREIRRHGGGVRVTEEEQG